MSGTGGSDDISSLLDLSPCLFFEVQRDGVLSLALGRWHELVGREGNELAGRPVFELVHPDDRDIVATLLTAPDVTAPDAVGAASNGRFERVVRMRVGRGGFREMTWSVQAGGAGLRVAATAVAAPQRTARWVDHLNDPYHFLVDSLTDHAVVMLDPSGHVASWNHGAERIKGYTSAEVLGKHLSLFYTASDAALGKPDRLLAEARAAGRVEERAWRVRKDGTRFWANVVVTALSGAAGEPIGFVKVTRDETRRQEAEESLRSSEERMRLMIESTQDYAIFMLDLEGRVLSWNKGAEMIKGYTASEITGTHFSTFYVPDDVRELVPSRELTEALEKGRVETEGWRLRKDGSRFWASVVITALRGPDGKPVGFGKVTRDLTARRATEEHLRQSEERFRLLVDTISDYAILMLDPAGRVQSWNSGAERIKGYTAGEILGQHLSVFYAPDDVQERKPSHLLEVALAHGRAEDEGWRVRKDGTRFWANVVVTALRNAAGELRGFAKVTRDLTARRKMEDEIRALNADLERRVQERTRQLEASTTARNQLEQQLAQSQKMEAVGRLAGGVAHDFNNMLTVIKGHCEILDLTSLDVAQRDSVSEIHAAAERSAELTSQLLAFSRKQILVLQVIGLNEIVAGLEPLLRRLIPENIAIDLRLATDLGSVKTDPSRIEQVIVNLAVNARDAMPSGGTLSIETANVHLDEAYASTHAEVLPGPYVMVAVSDSGTGMDETTKSRLFEPFFTTKPKGRGTGLGLSTVHGIVRQSGGHIWVYSEPEHGTQFKVYLPRTEEVAPQAAAAAPVTTARGSATILLVEDEVAVRRLARSILVGAGYRVLEAGHGGEALAVLGEFRGPVDLLLTDVVMPGLAATDLSRRAKELQPAMRTLFMSGYTENAIVHHGVLQPDTAFLVKPFTRATLTRKVSEVLGTDVPRKEP